MRIASVGHAVFAVTMIGLGILSLSKGHFAPVWDPVPSGVPARELLIYFSAIVSLASGLGLLWKRTAALAARTLLAVLLLWLLLIRVPHIFFVPSVDSCWPAFEIVVMMAGAWVLYSWFATDWEKLHLAFAASEKGLRIPRVLYGFALVFFGLAHFLYLKYTASLVPGWLPWHTFWAYFTGCAFIAAGVAVVAGVYARLAASLSTIQIGLFLVLVWVPIVAAGSKDAFQWSETILNFALMAGAWVVADSFRGKSWFALRRN